MKTTQAYLLLLTDGFIACAPENHFTAGKFTGFTNHKVEVRQTDEGWRVDHPGKRPAEIFKDIGLLSYALRLGTCLANKFEAAAYRRALEKVNS